MELSQGGGGAMAERWRIMMAKLTLSSEDTEEGVQRQEVSA